MKCHPTRANLARVQDGLSLSVDADVDNLGVRNYQRIVPWVVCRTHQEQVHIKIRQTAAAYEFSQMAMEDRRSHRPDAQWKLLLTFAENRGKITWRDAAADRKNAKRRQLLARTLQDFFGLEDDPFERIADGKGWCCRFTVTPER